MSVSACKKLFFLTPGGHSWLIPLTLCLSMELRKSRSVWSEIPPWTIRIFPSITVAMGRRLKTSWNSWRISRPWVCKQARTVILKKSAVTVTKLQSAYWVVDIKKKKNQTDGMYLDFTLYFCMTSFVNPYLKKENNIPLNPDTLFSSCSWWT